MIVEVEKIKQTNDDAIDYNITVFKIKLTKKVVLQNAHELSAVLNALIMGGALKIVVNLQNLTTIDSTGIGVLINYAKLIRKNKGDIVLCNVTAEIYEILNVISLEKFIKIHITEVEAINSFRYI